jgi:hypothetical protein
MVKGKSKKIDFLSTLVTGKTHDYQLLKANFNTEKLWFDQKTVRIDLGFLGMATDYKIAQLYIPHKKKE